MFHLENDPQCVENFSPDRHVHIQFNHNSFALKMLLLQDENITELFLFDSFIQQSVTE